MEENKTRVLKSMRPWRDAFYYQKAETLYQLTYVFCQRFLPQFGDRTVDQMIQAARSGKQNIIEGTEDGITSTEMHIKLLNVSRSSLQELREDYRDFLISRNLVIWTVGHDRFARMQEFCKSHNRIEDYQPYMQKWGAEEMANVALTLCYMTDAMLNHQLKALEEEFVTQGGIKERMHAARTGYRKEQDAEFSRIKQEVAALEQEVERLRALLRNNGIEY